ncbi:hypothetical protein BSIN_4871 [Burkholderia singularis]|uniref:Uncharacterized protein n=1 Tax=Burkholderia singularis TaxID=1503053 RepID=A0A238H9R5_9BURK|nr:hypothetical protein BSIN_4871 [Burkholderia singularis]
MTRTARTARRRAAWRARAGRRFADAGLRISRKPGRPSTKRMRSRARDARPAPVSLP